MKMVKAIKGDSNYYMEADHDFSNMIFIDHPAIELTVEKINDALIDRRKPVLFSKRCINKNVGERDSDKEYVAYIAWCGGNVFELGFCNMNNPTKHWYHSGNLSEMMMLFNKWTCKKEENDEWSAS